MGQTTFQALKKRIEDYFDNKDSVSHYLRSNENNLNSYSIQVFNDSLNNVLKTITENGDVGTFADDKMEKLCEGFAEFEEPDLKTKFDNLLNLCHSLSSEISKAKLDLSERKNKDSEKEKKELKEKLEKELKEKLEKEFEEKLESKKKELEEKLEKEKKEFEENLEKEKKELEEKNKKLEEKLEEKEKDIKHVKFGYKDGESILTYEITISEGAIIRNLDEEMILAQNIRAICKQRKNIVMSFDNKTFLPDPNICLSKDAESGNFCLKIYGHNYHDQFNVNSFIGSDDNSIIIELLPEPENFEQDKNLNPQMVNPSLMEEVYIKLKVADSNPETSGINANILRFTLKYQISDWKDIFFKLLDSSVSIIWENFPVASNFHDSKTPAPEVEQMMADLKLSKDSDKKEVKIRALVQHKSFSTVNPSVLDVVLEKEFMDEKEVVGKQKEEKEVVGKKKEEKDNFIRFHILKFMSFEVKFKKPPGQESFFSFLAGLTAPGLSQRKLLIKLLLNYSKIVRLEKSYYAPFTSLIQSSGSGKSKLCTEILTEYKGIYLVFRKIGENGIPAEASWMNTFFKYVLSVKNDNVPINTAELATNSTPARFLLALNLVIEKYLKIYAEELVVCHGSRVEALRKLGKKFMTDKRVDDTINEFDIDFFGLLKKNESTVNEVIEKTMNLLKDDGDPFLVILDEADNLNEMQERGRCKGVNIVRRALHLLNPTTKILTVAVGTNSDVLDFIPALNDNSLRFAERQKLLPPLILSRNWDIFSSDYKFHLIEISKATLLNMGMFNCILTMGRPVWCSFKINEAVSMAEAKLKNGDPSKFGALFALLNSRAPHNINPHHLLSKTLARSYMARIKYVSSDGREMKVSYSSEPVLAMASRNILSDKHKRHLAFLALKKYIQGQAIDKGRIIEVIFEHLTLFAIDDATAEPLKKKDAAVFPKSFQTLINCDGYILSLSPSVSNSSTTTTTSSEPSANDNAIISNYRIVKVRNYLKMLVPEKALEKILPHISNSILEGYVNTTQFINLKRAKIGEFNNINGRSACRDRGKTVIDRALLISGLLRQCGFVMPPGYEGIDFIIPVLMESTDKKPIYTFIAIQSKTSDTNEIKVLKKMTAFRHLVKTTHLKDCNNENSCKKHYSENELEEIFSNSLVILKQFEGRAPELGEEFKTSERAKKTNNENVEESENEKPACPAPDSLKEMSFPDDKISFHEMTWSPKDSNPKQIMTCIVLHDLSAMEALVKPETLDVLRSIANYSPSSFDDVDPLHYAIVEDCCINGEFCEYPSFNKYIRELRGLNQLKVPIEEKIESLYSDFTISSSIRRCLEGGLTGKSFLIEPPTAEDINSDTESDYEPNTKKSKLN